MDALVTSAFETVKYILIRQIRVDDIVLQGLLATLIGAVLIYIRTEWQCIYYYVWPITSAQFNDSLYTQLNKPGKYEVTFDADHRYFHMVIYHLRQTVFPPDPNVSMIYRVGTKIIYANGNNEPYNPIGYYMSGRAIVLYYDGRDYVLAKIPDSTTKIDVWASTASILVKYMEKLHWPASVKTTDPEHGKVRLYHTHDAYRFVYIDEPHDLNTWVFRHRSRVLAALQNMNNPAYLNGYGPKNLGILLHGPPGTGKTSFVRVLARHTHRDIVTINLRAINTITAFTKLYDMFYLPRTIFYIDEADFVLCPGDNNIAERQKELKQRRLVTLASGNKDTVELIKKELDAIDAELRDLTDLFTVDWLLQFLDGIQTCADRIIILTTNNPDKIYQPLLRPGRIDLNLKMDYFSTAEVIELLKQIYPGTEIQLPGRLDDQYTPADIINAASQCGSVQETIQRLWQGREKQD